MGPARPAPRPPVRRADRSADRLVWTDARLDDASQRELPGAVAAYEAPWLALFPGRRRRLAQINGIRAPRRKITAAGRRGGVGNCADQASASGARTVVRGGDRRQPRR